MSDDLIVTEQREVEFYGDSLSAVRVADGRIYVSFAQVCEALGVDTRAQRRRLQEHDILSDGLAQGTLPTSGGPQRMYLMRVDLVPLWLAGIRAGAVREELRAKLLRFQREAATVLWEAFQEGRLTTADPTDLFAGVSPESVQAYQLAQAVLHLARNQMLMEQRLGGRLAAMEERLETVEAAMAQPDRFVTQDEASQISQAVKAVALAVGKKSGRNEFGAVYGELYRKFGITGYKQLPARRFQEAMRFLTEWHENVTDSPLPF
ncbi:MAG: ORF6C domain-containing protein [Candidatus Promineofilum sp.]|nr:ORF6C domain-containing protein [Promineifilum sp.]